MSHPASPMRALTKRVIKWFFRAPGNLFVGSSDQFLERVQRAIRRDVAIASRFLPYRRGERAWAVALDGTASSAGPLPVPPSELWLDYGRTVEAYLESGHARARSEDGPVLAFRAKLDALRASGYLPSFLEDFITMGLVKDGDFL